MNPTLFQPQTTPQPAPIVSEDLSTEVSPPMSAPSPAVLPPNNNPPAGPLGPRALRRALLTAVFAVVLTAGVVALVLTATQEGQNSKSAQLAERVPPQSVELSQLASGSPLTLDNAADTLVINADTFARGTVRFYQGQFYFVLQPSALSDNRTYQLPDASGTICTDVNNCNFASGAQIAQLSDELDLQGQQLDQLSAADLSILVGGIDESEVSGEIEAVTAGSGLTGGGTAGSVTLNIASANGGITVNPDNIALTLQVSADGLSSTTSSGSGLEVLGGGLTLLQGCANNEILKWNEASDVWACGGDNGAGNTFETMNAPAGTDPVADASTDTLNLTVAGTNITITGNAATDTLDFDIVESVLAGGGLVVSGDSLAVGGGSGISVAADSVALGALTADWSQTGAFDIILNNASSELRILESLGGAFYGSLDIGDLSADRTYTFPDATGTVCLTTGNCAGVGGTGDILNNGNSFGAPVTIGTNDSQPLNFETAGTTVVTLSTTGAALFKNSTNSTSAFQIQDAAGTPIIVADTTYTDGSVDTLTVSVTPDDTAGTLNGLVISQADSINTNGLDAGLRVNNLDTNLAIGAAIQIANTGGGNYTNVFDVLGTLISAAEFNVLDAEITLGTETAGNYVATITAGNGLTGDATGEGSAPTIAVVSANGGIVVNANDIALTLQPSADALSITSSSGSGLEILSGGLTLLQGCSNNQFLMWNETTDVWACASSLGAGAFVFTLSADGGVDQSISAGDTLEVTGGAGLTSTASATDTVTLDVGAGSGITVNANDVAVNQNFSFAWTADHTWTLSGAEDLAVSHDGVGGAADVTNITVTPSATAGSLQGLVVTQANSANTNPLDAGLVIHNADLDLAIPAAIKLSSAGGGFTNLFDVAGTLISVAEFTALDGGISLDEAYDADPDKQLDVDSTLGLTFDLTTTGDFIIEDAGIAFLTIDDTGGYSFTLDATDNPGYTITNNGAGNIITNLAGTGDFIIQDGGTAVFTVNDSGQAIFQNAADSATAFRVQNLAGNNYLLVNTSGASISLGDAGIASTIQIGNTTGAVTQTLNIGNNSTASSTTNINIGSSVAGTVAITGPTTVTNRTSGASDTFNVSNSTSTGTIAKFQDNVTTVFSLADGGAALFQNQTNSVAAFRVQNAAGTTNLFSADTSNTQLSLVRSIFSGNVLSSTSATSQSTSTTNSLVDSGGTDDVGKGASLAIGVDGFPIISYFDTTNADLKATKCGNAACSSGNITSIVDNSLASVGQDTAIAIGTDGLPIIAYYTTSGGNLRVSKCANIACTSLTSTTDVDTINNVGRFPAIAIGSDGFAVVSHWDITNTNLRVSKCNNTNCTATTNSEVDATVDGTANVSSIAIGTDGLPVISYYDAGLNLNLKVTKCGNASCSSGNTTTTIESTGDVGSYNAIDIGADGLPIIAFYDLTNADPKLIKCANASCTSASSSSVIDSGVATIGQDISVAIGTDGLPIASYKDGTNTDLRVTRCGNLACSSGNTSTTVEASANILGEFTSIATGVDGLPVIAHHDNTADDLKVARCGNTSCSGTSSTYTGGIELGSYSTVFQNAYIQSIRTPDSVNSFTLATNNVDRLSVDPSGNVTFKNTSSASAFRLQNASGTSLFTLDTANSVITISGTTTTFVTLTLSEAHFKSTQTTAPSIGTPTSCGTTPSAAVTSGSTDSAGSFTITAGTGTPGNCDTVITFNKTYAAAPKSVVIVPTTAVGASPQGKAGRVSATAATTFTVQIAPTNPAASEVNSYYYWVVE